MKVNWFKIVLLLVILLLGYLFALNGRYEKMNDSNPNIFIDKWTLEIVEVVKLNLMDKFDNYNWSSEEGQKIIKGVINMIRLSKSEVRLVDDKRYEELKARMKVLLKKLK